MSAPTVPGPPIDAGRGPGVGAGDRLDAGGATPSSRSCASSRAARGGMLGLFVLVFFVVVALIAPFFFPRTVLDVTQATGQPFEPPSLQFPLGTDDSGRERPRPGLWGARISLLVGLAATVLSMFIGTTIGIIVRPLPRLRSAARSTGSPTGSWSSPTCRSRSCSRRCSGARCVNIIIVIGVTSWPGTARLIRAQTLSVEGRPYLERARALGAGNVHQMTQHVLPNVMPLVLANTTLAVSISILSETTLSFLGLGDPEQRVVGLDPRAGASPPAPSRRSAWWYVGVPRCLRRPRRARVQPDRSRHRGDPRPARRRRADGPPRVRRRRRHLPLARGRRARGAQRLAARRRRRDARHRRRVRLRQDHAHEHGAAACSRRRRRVDGQVRLDGKDVTTLSWGKVRALRWAQASVVFQGAMHALNPVQRIGDQLAEPILLHSPKTSKAAADTRVGELLEMVGLPARRAQAYPHQLSGGQKQRVMIAMALACGPQLIVADEPTTALDVMVQAQVLDVIAGLVKDLGVGLVFISHDLSVLSSSCDRIAVMYAGTIVEEGPGGDRSSTTRSTPTPVRSPARSRASATRASATRPRACRATRRSPATCRPAARSTRGARAPRTAARPPSPSCCTVGDHRTGVPAWRRTSSVRVMTSTRRTATRTPTAPRSRPAASRSRSAAGRRRARRGPSTASTSRSGAARSSRSSARAAAARPRWRARCSAW